MDGEGGRVCSHVAVEGADIGAEAGAVTGYEAPTRIYVRVFFGASRGI